MRNSVLILSALACACAPAERPSTIEVAAVQAALSDAAAQVKRCFRWPKAAHSGRQISTRLRIRLAEDGSLAGIPAVISQSGVTPENQLYATRMAEAAGEAVMRCAPLRMPAELYRNGWDSFDLTFSPAARG